MPRFGDVKVPIRSHVAREPTEVARVAALIASGSITTSQLWRTTGAVAINGWQVFAAEEGQAANAAKEQDAVPYTPFPLLFLDLAVVFGGLAAALCVASGFESVGASVRYWALLPLGTTLAASAWLILATGQAGKGAFGTKELSELL